MFKHYFELIENVSVWPIVSLSIFFGFFLMLILWLLKVDKKHIQKMKNLPLDDETPSGPIKSIPKSTLLLIMVIGTPLTTIAQEANRTASDQETLVTVLVLLVVIISILVLLVAVYTLSVLKLALEKDRPETVSKERQENWFWEKFNKSVAREQEDTILLDHNYDGIRELDNHLPPWWTAFFYITIVFGVIYMLVYHVFSMAPLPGELYDISVAEAKVAEEARLTAANESGEGIDESTVTLSDEPALLENGKKIYDMQCASCHRDDGGGNIGPNLTDPYWIHGGSIGDIFRTIKYGVPQKGMISWEPLLSPEQMRDVSLYIISLVGTNPPNAKESQGELYDPDSQSAPNTESTTKESESQQDTGQEAS